MNRNCMNQEHDTPCTNEDDDDYSCMDDETLLDQVAVLDENDDAEWAKLLPHLESRFGKSEFCDHCEGV